VNRRTGISFGTKLSLTTILALIICALTIVAWRAAATPPADPSVDEILARYVTALGGRSAISKHTSRISKGTLELVGVTTGGTAESYSKAPSKYLSVINIPGYGEVRRCFDGQSGWTSGPDSGIQSLTGQDLSSTRRDANFYQSLDLKKIYPQMTLKGKEDVGTWPAYIVEASSSDGTVRRMYFDVSSGLLVRIDDQSDTPQGPDTVQSFLEDYRDVGGVKQPFTVRQVHGNVSFIVHLSEVTWDQPIDDAKFAKPAQ
jgi:zinc protease